MRSKQHGTHPLFSADVVQHLDASAVHDSAQEVVVLVVGRGEQEPVRFARLEPDGDVVGVRAHRGAKPDAQEIFSVERHNLRGCKRKLKLT